MKKLKLLVIKFADWIDWRVLDHRFHPWLCDKISNSSWWDL